VPKFIAAIFVVLHGLVHLLYSGHSRRMFEIAPGLAWPDGSWVISKILGNENARLLATLLLAVAAVLFVAGGVAIFASQGWWRPAVVAAAALSAAIFVLFWDGRLHRLPEQGAIAILINVAILLVVLVLGWPALGS
jgi:hypothetical protein